jgi:hypothetical protein
MHVGTHVVDTTAVAPHPDVAGVDELHLHLPQDFPLRLYQSVAAETETAYPTISGFIWNSSPSEGFSYNAATPRC